MPADCCWQASAAIAPASARGRKAPEAAVRNDDYSGNYVQLATVSEEWDLCPKCDLDPDRSTCFPKIRNPENKEVDSAWTIRIHAKGRADEAAQGGEGDEEQGEEEDKHGNPRQTSCGGGKGGQCSPSPVPLSVVQDSPGMSQHSACCFLGMLISSSFCLYSIVRPASGAKSYECVQSRPEKDRAVRIRTETHGVTWRHTQLYGDVRRQWKCTQSHGAWSRLESRGIAMYRTEPPEVVWIEWSRPESHGVAWGRTESRGVARSRTESHGVARSRTESHGASRSRSSCPPSEKPQVAPWMGEHTFLLDPTWPKVSFCFCKLWVPELPSTFQ
eukprot:gene20320-biopygen5573